MSHSRATFGWMKLLISLVKFHREDWVFSAHRWRSAVVKVGGKQSYWNTDTLFMRQTQTSSEWMQRLTARVWVASVLLPASSRKYHIKNSVVMNADLFWTLNANKQEGGALTSRGWMIMGRWGNAGGRRVSAPVTQKEGSNTKREKKGSRSCTTQSPNWSGKNCIETSC